MKRRITTFAAVIVFLSAVLFTAITYYTDIVNEQDIEISKLTNTAVRLEDKLMKQVEAIRYKLPDSTRVCNSQKEKVNLISLVEDGPRIGLYIDRLQCEPCWQAELNGLAYYLQKTEGLPQPFVLAANYNVREVKLLAQRNATDIPMYITDELEALNHISKLRKPFFFVLEPDGTVASVYYPDEQSIASDSIYFNTIARKYRKTAKPVATHQEQNGQQSLHILKEKIDIGEVGMRKKKEVVFQLANEGKEACDIYDIRMSCTCLMLKSMPQVILPGETGEIRVNFLSTSKGRFSRTLQLTTSTRNLPYTLTIVGTVI